MCGAGTEASDDQSLETPGDLGQPRLWDPNVMVSPFGNGHMDSGVTDIWHAEPIGRY